MLRRFAQLAVLLPKLLLLMIRNLVVFLFTIACFTHCGSSKNATATATAESLAANALQPYGRTRLTADGGLELISSGVHFSFGFNDTACDVYAALPSGMDHNYLQYELDGA
jgi:hypothetical protein